MFRMWYIPAKVIIKIPNSIIKSGFSFKKKNDKISVNNNLEYLNGEIIEKFPLCVALTSEKYAIQPIGLTRKIINNS